MSACFVVVRETVESFTKLGTWFSLLEPIRENNTYRPVSSGLANVRTAALDRVSGHHNLLICTDCFESHQHGETASAIGEINSWSSSSSSSAPRNTTEFECLCSELMFERPLYERGHH